MRALSLVIALLAVSVLGGCIGSNDEPVGSTSKARADVTSETGGLEGVVTDNAIQPVIGAIVRIVELELETTTSSDGSYAFSRLTPGTYTLSVMDDGFVPATQPATVVRNKVVAVDFILIHVFTDAAFIQELELAGFLECGTSFGWNLTGLGVPQPPEPIPDARDVGYSLRPCEQANVFDNTTSDRSNHYWEFAAPIQTMVFESVWADGTGFAGSLWIDAVIAGFHCPNYCDWSAFDISGPSPLTSRVDRDRFQHIQEYFLQACEEGDESRCGHSFFDDGWDLWSRVYPRWECQELPVSACVPFQQSYTHYVTGFFNQPGPLGYTALR